MQLVIYTIERGDNMKKLLSLLMCLLMLMGTLAVSAGAMSVNKGVDALNEQFLSGDGVMDYVYYSPVKSTRDTTKYPLIVWLHGNSSGDYPCHQLKNCKIGLWSSDEYQSRVKGTKGAFLFLPRYPTGSLSIAWEGTTLTLKSSIDAFIKEHESNIDTNRIYIGGYSMGGKMVLRMASTYPDFFAAAFPLSPVYAPTNTELNNLVDMPIWFAWCKNDTYISLNSLTVKSNWDYLMKNSNCKNDCRLVTFDKIYYSDGSLRGDANDPDVHNTWDAATHDFFMDDGSHYKDVTITDGEGNVITLKYPNGLISWMSSYSKSNSQSSSSMMSALTKLFSKIVEFFKALLNALIPGNGAR